MHRAICLIKIIEKVFYVVDFILLENRLCLVLPFHNIFLDTYVDQKKKFTFSDTLMNMIPCEYFYYDTKLEIFD